MKYNFSKTRKKARIFLRITLLYLLAIYPFFKGKKKYKLALCKHEIKF